MVAFDDADADATVVVTGTTATVPSADTTVVRVVVMMRMMAAKHLKKAAVDGGGADDVIFFISGRADGRDRVGQARCYNLQSNYIYGMFARFSRFLTLKAGKRIKNGTNGKAG